MSKEKIKRFEDYLGIKEFYDDIILTNEGRYLTIVQVEPINFNFKTAEDQAEIVGAFERWLRICPVKFQIKSISRRTDVEKLINKLHNDFLEYGDKKLENLENEQINLIRSIGGHEGVEREFYIILEFTNNEGTSADDFNGVKYWLERARDDVKKFLFACGNNIVEHSDMSWFYIETLYKILNKNKSVSEMYDKLHEILERANEYYDYDEEAVENADIPVKNLLAPNNMDFNADYCVIDDTYYTFLYLPASSYKTLVVPAWLSGLINSGEGIDVDIFVKREDSSRIRKTLRTRQRVNKARIKHMEDTGENFSETEKALESGEYIKTALSNGEFFYYVSTLITISADDFDTMYLKYINIKKMLDSNDIQPCECEYMIDKAFEAYLPLNKLNPMLEDKMQRNVMSSGLSSFYPFTSYEVSDDDGILLGVNKENDSMCVLDNFNTNKYKNANIAILGTSGAGKTFTLSVMALRYRLKGIQTFIIAPIKGHEFIRACNEVGGQYVKFSSGSSYRINIMEIRPSNDTNKKLLGIDNDEDEILLNKKIDNLLIFFSLIASDMSIEEKQLLDDAIIQTYKKKGITKDNSSLVDHYDIIENEDGTTERKPVYKEMPILEDLYNVLKDGGQITWRLATILKRFVTGSASSFNGQTNVDLDNKFVIIDISNLSEELKPIGMFISLDYIWDKAKEDITKKKAIFLDETWMLIKQNRLAAKFTVEIFKVIRGYGGAAIAASQDIKDFFALDGGEYGKAIISNSKTKMVLNLESDEAKTVQEILGLSDEEKKSIQMFSKGEMLVVSNSNTFSLKFIASDYEIDLVTTDRGRLAKIAQRNKQKVALKQ